MENNNANISHDSMQLGPLLLEIGVMLLKAGASCSRTRSTLLRFTAPYNFEPHIVIGAKSVTISLNDKKGQNLYNGTLTSSEYGINFSVISAITRLSTKANKEGLTWGAVRKELISIQTLGRYPLTVVLFFGGIACSAFCFTFGGSVTEMLVTFCAALCGLFAKQQLSRFRINPYACTYVAALAASMVVAAVNLTAMPGSFLHAFSACVLFLIPGVLLINCFIDLLDGNAINGLESGTMATCHVLSIALGQSTTIVILNPLA